MQRQSCCDAGRPFLCFRATAFAIHFCSTILLPWRGIVKRKQKKCNLNKKKRMTPQNHPLKLVRSDLSILICTLLPGSGKKMFIALPAATLSGARTTRPAGMQRRSDWTGWSSPKYCFFLLYGLRCQDRDASHRYGVAGQLGFERSRREPQRIADNPCPVRMR